jgi:Exo-beta-D-glucosaminidase Ig-fold domain
LHNASDKLAFLVRLSLRNESTTDEVLPVLWDDNYVSLLPGESREVAANYLPQTTLPARVSIEVEGWNTERMEVPVRLQTRAGRHE